LIYGWNPIRAEVRNRRGENSDAKRRGSGRWAYLWGVAITAPERAAKRQLDASIKAVPKPAKRVQRPPVCI